MKKITALFTIIGFALTMVIISLLFPALIMFAISPLGKGELMDITEIILHIFSLGISMILFPVIYLKCESKPIWKVLRLQICTKKISIIIKVVSAMGLVGAIIGILVKFDYKNAILNIVLFTMIGIAEEILARGFVYYKLGELFGKIAATTFTALIFAVLMHSSGSLFANFLIRLPLSMGLTLLANVTGDLYSSIFLHSAYDLAVIILTI